MNRKRNLIVLLAAAVLLLAAVSCEDGARVGDLQTKTQTIERGDAEAVDVEIVIGAGELEVSGGGTELLDATFTYNVEELDPKAAYSNGDLVVNHEDVNTGIRSLFDLDDYRNEWDLQFGDGIPMEMNIDVGAGRTNLALGSLALTRLDLRAGAGEVDVDLSGSQQLERLEFDMGAGDMSLDLSGDWQQDLDASIDGGVGELSLTLPDGVGVRVEVDSGIGAVDTSGLSRDGDAYVNEAYGQSDVTLEIAIRAGVGKINLDVE